MRREHVSVSRRLLAAFVDGVALLLLTLIWWHWTEWARYTDTFGRHWPAAVAMPVMMIIPLTPLWVEAVAGWSVGKALAGLRVVGRPARRWGRSVLKWSPAWLGPLVCLVDALAFTTFADDFTNDWLLPITLELGEHLPAARPLFWAAGVSLRGMNWGAAILAGWVAGEILVLLPSRRSLLDRVCGTNVVRR